MNRSFVFAALSVVFLSIYRAAAISGLAFQGLALTPTELHDLLVAQETSLRYPELRVLATKIKQLRESLIYSLNESTTLAELSSYQELSQETKDFCDAIAKLSELKDVNAEQLDNLTETAAQLTIKASLVATKQIRR